MRPSLRFLGLAIVGWAGIRAATLGALPGAELFSVERSEAKTAPIVPTEFPEIAPIAPASAVATALPYQQAAYPQPIFVPIYYPRQIAPAPQAAKLTPILPIQAPQFYSPVPQLDEWPLSRIAASSRPARSQTTIPMQTTAPAILADRLDRVQLTMWAMLRGQQGQLAAQPSLASGGTLGGSQAGMRLFYNFSPQIAAVLRSSSDVGRRGGEVALGVRAQPLRSLPVWITAERRQALGKYGGGRNAFAVFAETGVYGRPLPWGFSLDGYAQAGVVDFRSRDLFADGGFTVTRPIFSNFSGGFGIWGGIQPHLYRVDVGPRVTMRVRRNLRVHLDWRQRIAGNAAPGSGPALTLAGDF
jgi:hypothetical protein